MYIIGWSDGYCCKKWRITEYKSNYLTHGVCFYYLLCNKAAMTQRWVPHGKLVASFGVTSQFLWIGNCNFLLTHCSSHVMWIIKSVGNITKSLDTTFSLSCVTQKSHAGTTLYSRAHSELFPEKMTHKWETNKPLQLRVQYHTWEFVDEGSFCDPLKKWSHFNAILSFFKAIEGTELLKLKVIYKN